jgi:hypothetical protein
VKNTYRFNGEGAMVSPGL